MEFRSPLLLHNTNFFLHEFFPMHYRFQADCCATENPPSVPICTGAITGWYINWGAGGKCVQDDGQSGWNTLYESAVSIISLVIFDAYIIHIYSYIIYSTVALWFIRLSVVRLRTMIHLV